MADQTRHRYACIDRRSPVEFQELQMAVVDEQHRFGVAQRAALRL